MQIRESEKRYAALSRSADALYEGTVEKETRRPCGRRVVSFHEGLPAPARMTPAAGNGWDEVSAT